MECRDVQGRLGGMDTNAYIKRFELGVKVRKMVKENQGLTEIHLKWLLITVHNCM